VKEIELTKGYKALVDDEDYARLMAAGPWFASVRKTRVYAMRNNRDKTFIYMHQLVMGEKGIDHEKGIGLDNQKHNLRPANHHQNAANMDKGPLKGTTFDKFTNSYKAAIMVDGKHINLGRRKGREEAAELYRAAAIAHFGEFANVIL
jgi:hypothetical protein